MPGVCVGWQVAKRIEGSRGKRRYEEALCDDGCTINGRTHFEEGDRILLIGSWTLTLLDRAKKTKPIIGHLFLWHFMAFNGI